MENKDNSSSKKKLEDYYDFERSHDSKEYEGLSFFQEVKRLIPATQKTAEKVDEIRKALRVNIKALKKEVEAQQKGQGSKPDKQESNFSEQDLTFCKEALTEGVVVKEKVVSGTKDLEDILSSGVERSYNVITDVALMSLPSDRAKNNEKNNGKNGNDGGGDNAPENPDKNQETGKDEGKLTPAQLAALRGTPERNIAAKKSADGQEQQSSIESSSAHKAENRDKVLAARNGIAPENRGIVSQPKPVVPRNVDYSQGMPKRRIKSY